GSRAQQLVELLDQPRRRAAGDLLTGLRNRIIDWRIDAEVQPRCHRHGTEHANRIFLETLPRVADTADQAVAKIGEAARVVDDRKRSDVVEERVDGEVAPERI